MLAMLLLLAPAGVALEAPPLSAALPDPDLDTMRGGFRLPNGIDVALAVQTQTAVNGNVVLRSVFTLDQGPARFTVQAPAPGQNVAAPQASHSATTGMPTVSYDMRNGLQVTPSAATSTVGITAGQTSSAATPDGLATINAPAATDAGAVSVANTGGLQTARLDGPDLSVVHFAGNAFGSLVANMANDRAIDTTTTVSIDLRGAGPDTLGSAGFRVENVALDAVRMRGGL